MHARIWFQIWSNDTYKRRTGIWCGAPNKSARWICFGKINKNLLPSNNIDSNPNYSSSRAGQGVAAPHSYGRLIHFMLIYLVGTCRHQCPMPEWPNRLSGGNAEWSPVGTQLQMPSRNYYVGIYVAETGRGKRSYGAVWLLAHKWEPQ